MLYPSTSSREQWRPFVSRESVVTFQSDNPLEIPLYCQILRSRDSITKHNTTTAGNFAKVNTSFLDQSGREVGVSATEVDDGLDWLFL